MNSSESYHAKFRWDMWPRQTRVHAWKELEDVSDVIMNLGNRIPLLVKGITGVRARICGGWVSAFVWTTERIERIIGYLLWKILYSVGSLIARVIVISSALYWSMAKVYLPANRGIRGREIPKTVEFIYRHNHAS